MKPLLTDINPRLLLAKQLWDLREQYNIVEHSRFGWDLFWQLVNTSASPYSLSIKSLNADGMAVPSALRKTLRRLEHEGWIRIDTHPDDQRIRCVLATPKFQAVAKAFIEAIVTCIDHYDAHSKNFEHTQRSNDAKQP